MGQEYKGLWERKNSFPFSNRLSVKGQDTCFLGSTAHEVIHLSDRPVLVVR
jgi:hypothetical protein